MSVVHEIDSPTVIVACYYVDAIGIVRTVDLRDNICDIDGEGDRVGFALNIAIEVNVHIPVRLSSEGLHPVVYPIPCGAYTASLGLLCGEGMPRAEVGQGGDDGFDPGWVDLSQHRFELGVGFLRFEWAPNIR